MTVLVAAGAAWVTAARREWIVARNGAGIRWRFAAWTLRNRTFESGTTVHLEHTRDSDGDNRYTLAVRSGAGRRVLATTLHDQLRVARARRVAQRAHRLSLRPRRHFSRATGVTTGRTGYGRSPINPVHSRRLNRAVGT